MTDLKGLFYPSSIAIVGVSRDSRKVGHLVAKNLSLQGFTGDVFYVNNQCKEVLNKKTTSSLLEIKKPVDLVVLAIPAVFVLEYLEQMAKIGSKYAVVYAAGFKETGENGEQYENTLIQKAKEHGITLLGPNCIGYINTKNNVNVTFLKNTCPKGNIALVSQSGALGSLIVDHFISHKNLGLSYFVSLGNKSVIDESDALKFLSHDEDTKVIGLYIEDIKDGMKFRHVLEEVSRIKPIVVIKSGTTSEGSKAAISHTGAMVGDDQIYDALFNKYDVIRAKNLTQFLAILKIFSFKKIPSDLPILILSNAGGIGVLMVDEIVKNKLPLLTISPHLKNKLTEQAKTSRKVNFYNPIDLLGDASAFDFKTVITNTIKEKQVGSIIVLLTPQANTEIEKTAEAICAVEKHFDKPIYPIFMGKKSVGKAHDIFEANKIASFTTYDFLPEALTKIVFYEKYRRKKIESSSHTYHNLALFANEHEIRNIIAKASKMSFLNLQSSFKVLRLIGVPITDTHYVKNVKEAENLILKLQYPVVAKIASSFITHKTEVKGVITSIKDKKELEDAFLHLSKIKGSSGCLLQKMLQGHELLIGAKKDPQFGIIIVLGLGGIYAELLKDYIHCMFPFTQDELQRALQDTKIIKLLNGFRGSKPVEIESVYSIMYKLGFLLDKFTEVNEVDVNPLMVVDGKLTAVDARIVL